MGIVFGMGGYCEGGEVFLYLLISLTIARGLRLYLIISLFQ